MVLHVRFRFRNQSNTITVIVVRGFRLETKISPNVQHVQDLFGYAYSFALTKSIHVFKIQYITV